MNPAERLAEVVTALERAGLTSLVMGGHAVRFYGLERNTNDFDLHLSPQDWDELPQRLIRSGLFGAESLVEGPSWRPPGLSTIPNRPAAGWPRGMVGVLTLEPFIGAISRAMGPSRDRRIRRPHACISVLARPDSQQGNGTGNRLARRVDPGRVS